ncbi:MAG: hypothetical protein IRY94_05625, partial [Rhodospirillaceae bacterium]|nr:hypothetical protein [Rhodospirillaceae bacterium]
AARALRRFAAAPAQTWGLAETLPALEAAAGLGCRRALLRTRAGRRTQAQGVPDHLLPVAVYADLFAAADAMREEGG